MVIIRIYFDLAFHITCDIVAILIIRILEVQKLLRVCN